MACENALYMIYDEVGSGKEISQKKTKNYEILSTTSITNDYRPLVFA